MVLEVIIPLFLYGQVSFNYSLLPEGKGGTFKGLNTLSLEEEYLVDDFYHQQEHNVGKPKKVLTTLLLSFFPGFFVHGLGHYCIGDNMTGTILLSTEIVGGITSLYSYIAILACGLSECSEGEFNASYTFFFLGMGMFWGSWLYDVIVAPIKASKMRKEYEQRKKDNQIAPEIGFLPTENFKGGKLALTWRF